MLGKSLEELRGRRRDSFEVKSLKGLGLGFVKEVDQIFHLQFFAIGQIEFT